MHLGGVWVLVGPPVFKLCFRGSGPFVGVCDLGALGATARHGPQSSAGVAVAIAVGGRPRLSHWGKITLVMVRQRHWFPRWTTLA